MSFARRKKRRDFPFEQRVFVFAILAGLPGGFVALTMLWRGPYTPKVQWTFGVKSPRQSIVRAMKEPGSPAMTARKKTRCSKG